jgi:hypothetical protein
MHNGIKHYFMVMAVEQMGAFAALLGRVMPLHVFASGTAMAPYLTEEQMIAELKSRGLPVDLIHQMRRIDAASVINAEEEMGHPYDEPEADR